MSGAGDFFELTLKGLLHAVVRHNARMIGIMCFMDLFWTLIIDYKLDDYNISNKAGYYIALKPYSYFESK